MDSVAAEPRAGRAIWSAHLGSAAVVLIADQLTKWWALEALESGRPIDVLWKLRWTLT